MIGEFLLEVTLLHAVIYFTVNLIILFLIARYKPTLYYNTYRILLIPIGLIYMYRMGWEASITHHDISYGNQSRLPDFEYGIFTFLMLFHYLFFEKVAEKWIGLGEETDDKK